MPNTMKPFESNLSTLAIARDVLLTPFGLDEGKLLQALGAMFTHKVDYADLYFEYSVNSSLNLEEQIVKSANRSVTSGHVVGSNVPCELRMSGTSRRSSA